MSLDSDKCKETKPIDYSDYSELHISKTLIYVVCYMCAHLRCMLTVSSVFAKGLQPQEKLMRREVSLK